ncbi:MAG TPA: SIS domain-containing protein [Arenicellales bacterium]|nr:SIS domain-containing protein [Arenicellales bacterium]
MDIERRIKEHFDASATAITAAAKALTPAISQAAQAAVGTLTSGGKLLICGNGGSASDALHFAAELVCRFERERQALAAIALPADTATLTAAGNDYDFERVFSRQVEALGRPGDLLVVITTSGNSPNILKAVTTAAGIEHLGIIALNGKDGGQLPTLLRSTDIELRVPATSTAHIQEVHAIIIHCLCDLIDQHFIGDPE